MTQLFNPRATARAAYVAAAVALAALAPAADAQPLPAAQASPRASAAIDVTGYWVSIVNEDWRWRMRTPPKGDYASVQTLNPRGRAVADQWEPEQDGSCKAYGAGGLLRMPTRLHITWADERTLEIETDAGEQTRLLRFDAGPATGPPTLQGHSAAAWRRTLPPPGRMGFAPPPGLGPQTVGGSLTVTTTNLAEGWLRRNGVPYSERTTLTEHFDRFAAPSGDEWLVVTTIVEDPVYHFDRFVTSSHFRREPNDAKWNPTVCRDD